MVQRCSAGPEVSLSKPALHHASDERCRFSVQESAPSCPLSGLFGIHVTAISKLLIPFGRGFDTVRSNFILRTGALYQNPEFA